MHTNFTSKGVDLLMGQVIHFKPSSKGIFSEQFLFIYTNANLRSDYHRLLEWVVDYYIDPDNHKEHPLFAVLSVIYESCPEAFLDYVKDFDAVERDFIITAKIMFENDEIDRQRMIEWKTKILGSLSSKKQNFKNTYSQLCNSK